MSAYHRQLQTDCKLTTSRHYYKTVLGRQPLSQWHWNDYRKHRGWNSQNDSTRVRKYRPNWHRDSQQLHLLPRRQDRNKIIDALYISVQRKFLWNACTQKFSFNGKPTHSKGIVKTIHKGQQTFPVKVHQNSHLINFSAMFATLSKYPKLSKDGILHNNAHYENQVKFQKHSQKENFPTWHGCFKKKSNGTRNYGKNEEFVISVIDWGLTALSAQ